MIDVHNGQSSAEMSLALTRGDWTLAAGRTTGFLMPLCTMNILYILSTLVGIV